jgi:serine protease
VNQWIGSPGHNAIMSTDYYNTIGIGIAFTDMSQPEDPSKYRFGMYGTANLFTYDSLPPQTYNHPRDYFAGKPPLPTAPAIKTVTPSAPIFTETGFTIPEVEGVEYQMDGYEIRPGTWDAFRYQTDITLVPKQGFAFPAGTQTTYTHFFEHLNPNPALIEVAPAAPEFRHASNTYVIPSVKGVQYQVNGYNASPGTYPAPSGENVDVVITASPLPGYSFGAGAVSRWEARMRVPSTITVTPAAPTFDSISRTYTIPSSGSGISYRSNGQTTTPGTYPGTGTVVVDALPLPGYTLTGVTSWTYTFPAEPTNPAPPVFADVPAGAQFSTEIGWMASAGISTGWTEADGAKSFRPLSPVNRDAMAAFMYRLAGKPAFTPPASSPFTDVPASSQFYKEITWLAAQGVSTGWTEADGTKTYRPLQAVNRDAMAAFMYRLAGKPAFTPPASSPFTDVPASSQFYKEITWLAAQGISTGWTEAGGTKTYRPLLPVNRDAMAAFMYRYNTKSGSH